MSNPLEDALGSPEVSEENALAPVAEAVAEAPAEVEDPAKGPDASPVAGAPPAPQQPTDERVPLATLMTEREKRQAAERQLAELRAKEPPPAPLEATQALQQALYDQKLDISRALAEQKYGAETVEKVHAWAAAKCDADPHFNQQMRSARLPYEAAFQAFNADRVLQSVKPDQLDAFLAWQTAQEAAAQGEPTPKQPAAPTPPRSLVSAPGSGLGGKPPVEVQEGAAFGAAFG